MANQQNGGRNGAFGDEDRPSWRPQDQQTARSYGNEDDRDYRSWRERSYHDEDRYAGSRDPQRWEGSRGSELGYHDDRGAHRFTERYGQGQSGYSAGRYGDRAQRQLSQNRNEMISSPGRYANRYEDRNDLGVDDRFTGRGGSQGHWTDRSERGHHPERYGAQGGYGGGSGFDADRGRGGGWRPDDDHMGYQGGSSRGMQRMGYQAATDYHDTQFRQDARRDWSGAGSGGSESQRGWGNETGNEAYGHRGQGPHRGKGPSGFRRSDERVMEMVCEALSDDDHIDATHIEVTVKNGEVTLTGSVDNRQAKRDAEDCACSVSGVRDVLNQLRINDDRQAARTTAQSQSFGTGQPAFGAGQASPANGKHETETQSQDKKPRA